MENQNNQDQPNPNQFVVSNLIVKYLCDEFKANKYHSSQPPIKKTGYTVRYSHTQVCEPDWPKNEEIALYIREKGKNSGNNTQIAVPDIALINEDTNQLKILIEVESSSDFKNMMRCMGPIAMADVYSPTFKDVEVQNLSSDGNDYSIKDLMLFILVLTDYREQFKDMRKRLIQMSSKTDTGEEKRINVYFDADNDPAKLVSSFKTKLETIISNNEFSI